ncbi:hypothetical protein SKAU_G00112270 [Synaphobranchus kaupii]|uniref:Uncharacterized protein n=1 Tax=Synaphobranchus kaupii TaxID=118154 RepID=A0A9Q1G0F3_SYNKA|nr:hypothetical protein SKAU_G00112270 [Synaphobranchus kaupii]
MSRSQTAFRRHGPYSEDPGRSALGGCRAHSVSLWNSASISHRDGYTSKLQQKRRRSGNRIAWPENFVFPLAGHQIDLARDGEHKSPLCLRLAPLRRDPDRLGRVNARWKSSVPLFLFKSFTKSLSLALGASN